MIVKPIRFGDIVPDWNVSRCLVVSEYKHSKLDAISSYSCFLFVILEIDESNDLKIAVFSCFGFHIQKGNWFLIKLVCRNQRTMSYMFSRDCSSKVDNWLLLTFERQLK